MRAWIKYLGKKEDTINFEKHNYTRFGKPIPKHETEIDILKYFGVKKEKAVYIAKSLKSDSRIDCRLGEDAKTAIKEYKVAEEKLNKNKPLVSRA